MRVWAGSHTKHFPRKRNTGARKPGTTPRHKQFRVLSLGSDKGFHHQAVILCFCHGQHQTHRFRFSQSLAAPAPVCTWTKNSHPDMQQIVFKVFFFLFHLRGQGGDKTTNHQFCKTHPESDHFFPLLCYHTVQATTISFLPG